MTKREAAIVGAYTGILLGDFNDMHAYIEELLQRPVFVHELGSKELFDTIKDRAKKDFIALVVEG